MARYRHDLPLEAAASVDDRDVLAAIARARRCLMATDPLHPDSDRLLAFRVAGSPAERLDALLEFADAIGAGASARRAAAARDGCVTSSRCELLRQPHDQSSSNTLRRSAQSVRQSPEPHD
ncbi:MAG: hypothetical protein WKF94_17215 [Solirubrobacteraceae bacterium]